MIYERKGKPVTTKERGLCVSEFLVSYTQSDQKLIKG